MPFHEVSFTTRPGWCPLLGGMEATRRIAFQPNLDDPDNPLVDINEPIDVELTPPPTAVIEITPEHYGGEDPIGSAIREGYRHIVLSPGSYPFPERVKWGGDLEDVVVIEAAVKYAGATWIKDADGVGNYRPHIKNLIHYGVTFEMDWYGQFYGGDWHYEDCCFFDSKGGSPNSSRARLVPFRDTEGQKHTLVNPTFYQTRYAACQCSTVHRGRAIGVWGDVIQNTQAMDDFDVIDLRGNLHSHHTDLIQFHSRAIKNALIQNVRCSGLAYQFGYFDDHPDTSFENVYLRNITGSHATDPHPLQTQASNEWRDCWIENVGAPQQHFTLRDDWGNDTAFKAENVVVKDSQFKSIRTGSLTPLDDVPGLTII